MGKGRSRKRRVASEQSCPTSIPLSLTGKRKFAVNENREDCDLTIDPDDLEITVNTLNRIASQNCPLVEHLADTRYKDLRRALYPFQEAWRNRFDPVDYPARVTSLLEQKLWNPALFALDGCSYYFENKLKRGTVQRWVRFCDECESPGMKLKLIAAILRCTTSEINPEEGTTLNRHDPRRALLEQNVSADTVEISNAMVWKPPQRKELQPRVDTHWNVPTNVRVVHHIAAKDRKPPNHYDLTISYTDTNLLTHDHPVTSIERHDVTPIPGAILLTNVLSAHECHRLIRTAETMGFSPDHPIHNSEATGIDTCEWLSIKDSEILFERVKGYLPSVIQHESVTGINARWRLFRYGPNSVYRPHIDGSWPASTLQDGKYVSDDSHRSRLTFLVYLNDGFEGGGTTFYLPKQTCLETITVTPQAGNILLFPQGNTASLVHEGSKVLSQGCCKYVIRTDVLYKKT